MNDWEITLVTQAGCGNSKCFEELYEQYHKKVFAVIRTTVKNRADAEDILQLTFLSAWRNLKNLSNPAAFHTWIQRIAINHCYELLRKKNIAILMDSESELDSIVDNASDEMLPAVYAEREDLRIRLGRILEDLSEVQRQTITLFYFNELKVEEIAEVMACSMNTVKTRLFLARKAIRSEIEEQERKSGQKFYGIAGIPMLGLSEIFTQQEEAMGLTTSAASSVLESITATIATEAAVAAQVAAASGSTASTASAGSAASMGATAAGITATGMALGVKIAVGIAVASLIGIGAVALPRLLDTRPADPALSAITAEQSSSPLSESLGEPESETERELEVYLTTEQLAFLEPLEAALLAYDMDAAFSILRSEEFQAICRSLPEPKGNTYKYDDSGQWLIAYFGPDETGVGENFQIALRTDRKNGIIYLAEAYQRDGLIDGGTMMTYDIVDGEVSREFYNGISAYYLDGQLIIE